MSKVVFLEGCEPDGLTAQKLEALHDCKKLDVHLVYWQRVGSDISMPFSVGMPKDNIQAMKIPVGPKLLDKVLARIKLALTIRKNLGNIKPDCIQVPTVDLLAMVLMFFGKRCKIVFDLRDTNEWMIKPLGLMFIRYLLRQVDLVIITSPLYESEFLRRYNILPQQTPVLFIPNVPDNRVFRQYARREGGDEIAVGYIGTFRGSASINAMAEAIALLREQGLNVVGKFFGTGPELPLVIDLCHRNNWLSYAGKYSYLTDIRNIYEQVDIVYAVYDHTTNKRIHLACRLTEAMACGLPSMVLKGTFMAALVENLGIGVVVESLSPDDIAEQIASLATDKLKLQEIRDRCATASPHFEFDFYRSGFIGAYQKLDLF